MKPTAVKRLLTALIPLLLLALCSSCASPSAKKRESLYTKEPDMFWPLPPEPPRIKHLYTLHGPADIGVGKSFFGAIKRFFLGETDADLMVRPYAIASEKGGRIAVADSAKKIIHIFYPAEAKYRRFPKDVNERLESPVGVAFDGSGNLYVSDSVLKRVNVYDRKGNLSFSIDKGFERPTGIAVNKQESLLYVVDTVLNKVLIFDLKGNMVDFFGDRGTAPGKFNFPTNVFVDKKGLVYVADSMNFRVQIFTRDGDFISHFGKVGDGTGNFSSPKGVSVDSEGNVYVVESRFDTVQIFNRQGDFLMNFGSRGSKRGEFWLPAGLYIDQSDLIYVADAYNSRVQVFQFLGSTAGEPILDGEP